MNRQLVHSTLSVERGSGTAVPLVKPTLRGILPHGSEAPWGPIPLRSSGLDDSPCLQMPDVGFVQDESPFPRNRTDEPADSLAAFDSIRRIDTLLNHQRHARRRRWRSRCRPTSLRDYFPMNGGATLLG
jgi:hypothetical protein